MKHQRGFTIAELMIVVIIAAILAAVAAPNMSEFVKNNARATNVNTMVTALNYARGLAVTRNARVTMCKAVVPAFNQCAAVGTGNFEDGFIVFVDGNTRGTVDGTDAGTIRIFQTDMGTATLIGVKGALVSVAIGGLSYESTGLGRDMAAGTDAIVSPRTVFRYCDDRSTAQARGIVISPTGYPRIANDITTPDIDMGCP